MLGFIESSLLVSLVSLHFNALHVSEFVSHQLLLKPATSFFECPLFTVLIQPLGLRVDMLTSIERTIFDELTPERLLANIVKFVSSWLSDSHLSWCSSIESFYLECRHFSAFSREAHIISLIINNSRASLCCLSTFNTFLVV